MTARCDSPNRIVLKRPRTRYSRRNKAIRGSGRGWLRRSCPRISEEVRVGGGLIEPCPASMMMLVIVVALMSGGRGRGGWGSADGLDLEIDIDRAGLLEGQRALERLAAHDRLLHVHHHDVRSARLELDGLARLDLDAGGERAHPHHAL